MRFVWLSVFILMGCLSLKAQELRTKNIIIITLDGYRWKELYEGADPKLLASRYTSDVSELMSFSASEEGGRERLMPFFWNTIASQGQLYGNRNFKNRVNCKNNHLLSYPGYSEMFVGYAARDVSSNEEKNNPNATVLEFIHKHGKQHRKVAAFATWRFFNYIFRKNENTFYVNAGNDPALGKISEKERRLNEEIKGREHRSDAETFSYAFEFLKRERPNVLFIGFDETDHYGHNGKYDEYLLAAHRIDKMIAELWNWIQTQPGYRDQTTLFITTDHGRGNGLHSWKNHRLMAAGSRHIWFAVLGPDTPAFGELTFKGKFYQKQVAKTIAAFLGIQYNPRPATGEVIQTMLGAPLPSDEIFSYRLPTP